MHTLYTRRKTSICAQVLGGFSPRGPAWILDALLYTALPLAALLYTALPLDSFLYTKPIAHTPSMLYFVNHRWLVIGGCATGWTGRVVSR
jgi:hypothetical protein